MRARTTIWVVAALFSSSLSAEEVLVQKKTTFNPELSLSQRYSDNVLFIDAGAEDTSDSSTSIGVRLPVVRRLRNGLVSFAYGTEYEKYRDNDAFDDTGHRLRIEYSTRLDRFSSLSVLGTYFLTQDQALLDPVNDEDPNPFASNPFLSQRTERTAYGGRVGYQRELSRRWFMSTSLGGTRNRFDSITGGEDPEVEDRETYTGTFRVWRNLTARTSMGVRYGYDDYSLEDSADGSLHRLAVTVGHAFSERFKLGFDIGGYRRTEDLPGGSSEQETGGNIGVNARFNEGLELGPVRLSFFAGVRPTAGLPYSGTATNSTALIAVSRAVDRPWYWNFSVQYTRRDPSRRSESNPEVSTLSIGPTVERRIRKLFGVRISQRYVDQDSPDSDRSDGSFYSFKLGLVWYPLGRTRIANM